MRNLKDSSLSPLWEELLQIYSIFADICDRHGLRFFVSDGSALGAIRHKGFIPWDDDFDVSMPRSDYDKFLSIARHELPGYLVAYDRRQCPELGVSFSKVQDIREDKVHEIEQKIGRKLFDGLYIDVFPLDGFPKSRLKAALQKFRFFLWVGLWRYRLEKFSRLSWKGKSMWLIGMAAVLFSRNMRCARTRDAMLDLREKLARQYEYDESLCVARWPNFSNYIHVYDKKIWDGWVAVEFHGVNVKLPVGYDDYLRIEYGDYMVLPPEGERTSTHVRTEYSPWWHGPTKCK